MLLYGLPDATDLNFLHGLVLSQLAIGENETTLWFEPATRIVIETDIFLLLENQRLRDRADVIARLVSCLGAPIDHVEWESDGTLRLSFSGHSLSLEIRDDSPAYESYAIHHGEQIIVV